jgi:hypothetical protein
MGDLMEVIGNSIEHLVISLTEDDAEALIQLWFMTDASLTLNPLYDTNKIQHAKEIIRTLFTGNDR